MNTVAMTCMMAVPSMLMVMPSGRTKEAMLSSGALLAYSLILAINRPIEMLVTSLNVVGDAVASICVAKRPYCIFAEKNSQESSALQKPSTL